MNTRLTTLRPAHGRFACLPLARLPLARFVVTASAALCLAPLGAHAAQSADLTVKGMIRPAACDIDLSGGATADFGVISARALSATTPTVLPARIVTLTITCNPGAKVGITTTDNRSGTVNDAASAALIGTPGYTFGVGEVGGKNIGAYSLMLGTNAGVQATADGRNVTAIYSQDGGNAWISSLQGPAQPGVRLHGWAAPGESLPGTFNLITQPIKVTLALGKTGDLPDLSQDVPIDGLATISLKYL